MDDFARKQTDKKLNQMERDIGRVYQNSPALSRVKKEYAEYMKTVQKRTQDAYKAYTSETDADTRLKLKKAYMDEVQTLTMDSKEYNALIKRFAEVIAQVNQQALDVSNDAMVSIYTMNYNQVAEECERVGIKVDGKK